MRSANIPDDSTVAKTFTRLLQDQWVLLLLLGGFTCAIIVLGGAIVYLIGDFLIPLLLVIGFAGAMQWQTVITIRRSARRVVDAFPGLFLTRTQRYYIDRSALKTGSAVIILACRLESSDLLREILQPLCQDYGYDYISWWLFEQVQLNQSEFTWLRKTLGFVDAVEDEVLA